MSEQDSNPGEEQEFTSATELSRLTEPEVDVTPETSAEQKLFGRISAKINEARLKAYMAIGLGTLTAASTPLLIEAMERQQSGPLKAVEIAVLAGSAGYATFMGIESGLDYHDARLMAQQREASNYEVDDEKH